MERTVPKVASEEIDLYLRTYYSLLRGAAIVKIRSLSEAHAGMNSLLHPKARQSTPDMSAFIYALLRLPEIISQVSLVILGQSEDLFSEAGFENIADWELVSTPARRRRSFFDGGENLAVMIASRSDIDDIVPMLTAFQIEWNKIHSQLANSELAETFDDLLDDPKKSQQLADTLQISHNDLMRLLTIWGDKFSQKLEDIAARKLSLRVQLINGSLTEYRRAIHAWWHQIGSENLDIGSRPVYFVSSNPHSLINLVTGFAIHHHSELLTFMEQSQDEHLRQEWEAIQSDAVPSSRENFYYYLLKKCLQTPQGDSLKKARLNVEEDCRIVRVKNRHSFDIQAQIIPLDGINRKKMDPRLQIQDDSFLKESDALILNIDYPLGLAAFQVLSEVSEHVGQILGVYIIGKAATLNGVVGDVMIPNVVYDSHSRNTYLFNNSLESKEVTPHLVYGTALGSQKAVTVRGTFLQNHEYMDVFYSEGYTDIEMEAGPYLSAAYEMTRPKRYPIDEIVNLYDLPFDFGMLHYASDKPLSKGKNLGVASLSYYGMDPTYAASIAVMRRIFKMEKARLAAKN